MPEYKTGCLSVDMREGVGRWKGVVLRSILATGLNAWAGRFHDRTRARSREDDEVGGPKGLNDF